MEFNHPNSLLSEINENLCHVPNVLYENRYCIQDDFNILICGGANNETSNDVYKLNGRTFECSKYPSMIEGRSYCESCSFNSDILVIGGYEIISEFRKDSYSVEIFENNNKSWSYKTEVFDKRRCFCICTFKQNLFIIGGFTSTYLKSCFVYNMKSDRWTQIADMNNERLCGVCTVYEGRIVVSGGNNFIGLKSVEAYDHYENKWTFLPDMNEVRYDHALVSMGNKMFVIGEFKKSTCEMFDSSSRRFCYIKTCSDFTNDMGNFQAVCIDNRIVIFGEVVGKNQTKVLTYNDDTSEWKLIDCSFLKNKSGFSSVKYHE